MDVLKALSLMFDTGILMTVGALFLCLLIFATGIVSSVLLKWYCRFAKWANIFGEE